MGTTPAAAARQAIDPMALILSGPAYVIWAEAKHPHVPNLAAIEAAFRALSREEQDAAVGRARAMAEYGRAVETAVSTIRGAQRRA